jgi:hypothetical protein
MNDDPNTNEPPRGGLSLGNASGEAPRQGFGIVGWLIVLGVVGLFLYSRLTGGASC